MRLEIRMHICVTNKNHYLSMTITGALEKKQHIFKNVRNDSSTPVS